MKKLLALVLSFAMILTMVNLPLVISAEDITENVATVYVSTLGSDDGDGTLESPYLTISKAMSVIEAETTATAGKIIVAEDDNGYEDDGVSEKADGINFTTVAHTKMMTIAGIDKSIILKASTSSLISTLGPIGFENITVKAINIVPNGHKVSYGVNAINSGESNIKTGFKGTVDGEDIYFYKNSGGTWHYCTVWIGNDSCKDAEYVVNGDVNFYAEQAIHVNQFDIRNGTYNGNVNLTFNGFSGAQTSSVLRIFGTPVFNGAVQVLWNNGLARSRINSVSFRENGPADKTWIMYGEKAKDGSILEMSGETGKFKVKGGMIANAYKIDVTKNVAEDGSVTYTETVSETAVKSKGGILDLSNAPGEYNVVYTEITAEENEDLVVYVSDTGSDVNDGKTIDTAFATIDRAENWLNMSTAEGEKVIYIKGTVDFDGGEPHTEMMTLKGYDDTAFLNFKSTYISISSGGLNACTLKGPTTFDGLQTLNQSDSTGYHYLVTGGHEFVIKNGKNTGWKSHDYYIGPVEDTPTDKRSVVKIENGGGVYGTTVGFHFGAFNNTNKSSAGVDFLMKNGRLYQVQFIKNTTFTGDVNLVFDNPSTRDNDANYFVFTDNGAIFNAALQIVLNNGKYSLLSDKAKANVAAMNAADGVWIIDAEKASDGSLIRTTEEEGKFQVVGEMIAKAYKVVDGVAEETASFSSANGYLDLSSTPGIYKVKFFTPDAEVNNDSVVYVSETGSNLNDGKTIDTAFGTLEFAINWLAKSTAVEKKIIVSGAEYTFVPVEYDGMLTITSVDGNTIIKFSNTYLLGNLTLDDVIISGWMYSNGNKVELTKKASIQNASSGVIAGATSANINKQDEIIINAGGPNSWSGGLRIGSTKTVASNGLKVVYNGGNFNNFVILNDWASGGTHYGDVNIIFNANLTGGCNGKASGNSPFTFEGALQIILNNNVNRTTLNDYIKTCEAKEGSWFMCVASGGTLDTTADEGVFKVESDLTAKAVNVETGEAYFSIGGYLTVPEGEYNVGFISEENIVRNIYVSQNGSDDNDGLSEASAVKTIAKALEISSKTARIVVLDTATYDIISAYSKDITIKGGTITGDITLYGDLIIENTVIDADSIDTNGNTLVIGKGVSFVNGKPSVVSDEVLLIESGDFANIRIEGNNVSKLYAYGATVEAIVVATTSSNAIVKVNVEGNANISFDNAEYKSVQVIFNKTTADVDAEAENSWIIGSEESGNSSLDFSDTEGKFTATTEVNKTPVAVSKYGETVYVADDFDNTYDEIDLDSNALTAHKDFINYRGGMPNVYKKLQNNEKLNVIYFGGSVTAGAGLPTNADREVYSWRAKIGAWLTNNFPNSNIKNINKSAGESGTYLGSYRIPYLIAENPDLLIIEYSINDFYYHSSYEDAAARFETIVREIKAALPDCDIITVLVTEKQFYTSASKNVLHTQAQAHDDVAAYYNIPSIKVGCALTSQIAYADWDTYFSDIVHPKAAGYQLYYNCIEEFFVNALLHADYDDDYQFVMPPVKSTYLFNGGRTVQNITPELVEASEAMGGSGYSYYERNDGETSGGIEPTLSGTDTFYFQFYGTEVALSFRHVGAEYFPLISIDGGENFVPTVRNLAHNPIVLAMDLEPGWHTVKVTSACTTLANQIQAIYYADASQHTLQGEGADENFKKSTLTLAKGTYNVKYLTSIEELSVPEKAGYVFTGWTDEEGNAVTELTAGAKLIASYEAVSLPEEDKAFDVSGDGVIDGIDLIEVMKKLLLGIVDEIFDVNGDGHSDIRDLVSLKNKIASLTE